MGAINYGTSTYLCNIGYNLNNDVADYEEAQDDQLWTAEEVKDYLSNMCLSFYKIYLIPGYYEGFYLDIKAGEWYISDDEDKQERVKELHKIGRALIDLANKFGLVYYIPGWVTCYAKNINTTIKAIKQAVKKEITAIYNATPKHSIIYF